MIVRAIWYVTRNSAARLRALIFRFLPGSFFRSVGRRCLFFGWPAFGSCNGNISIGSDCMIGQHGFFSASRGASIHIGDRCSLNTGFHVVAIYEISIGDGTRIGEFCSIRDQNHAFHDATQSVIDQGYTGGPVTIGKNCWIGRGVMICPGVTIGDGAIVGANAVVVKDVSANAIVAGVPARPIGVRGDRPSGGEDS